MFINKVENVFTGRRNVNGQHGKSVPWKGMEVREIHNAFSEEIITINSGDQSYKIKATLKLKKCSLPPTEINIWKVF